MRQAPLTYVVGDIHGCADQLDALLARIAARSGDRARSLVFLGDYIDRGPDSAGVLRALMRLCEAEPGRVTCLMGNHERMLLDALAAQDEADHWIASGGDATLDSFGSRTPADLPEDILAWVAARPTLHADDARWYVHAGLRPGVKPEQTSERDRLWIRGSFLEGEHDFGRHVVHGHTPQRSGRPDVRPFRTNLDTAAVYGGRLSAGVFTDESGPAVEFVQV